MEAPLIEFDAGKCIECGACARDCISGSIQFVAGKPEAVHPDWCNRCSHCVTVCPSGAIGHHGLLGETPRLIAKEKLDPDRYREIVLTRRSVRQFLDEPAPRSELEALLDLARYSPTASNSMDVGYIMITDRAKIRQTGREIFRQSRKLLTAASRPWARPFLGLIPSLRGIMRYADRFALYEEWVQNGRDPIVHDAPALLLIHGPVKSGFAAVNCAIAAANITNYAHARGLGSCYLGLVVTPLSWSRNLRRLLRVPADRRVYLALALGKPANRYRQTPVRPLAPTIWVE